MSEFRLDPVEADSLRMHLASLKKGGARIASMLRWLSLSTLTFTTALSQRLDTLERQVAALHTNTRKQFDQVMKQFVA